MSNILAVREKFAHMSSKSGYDAIYSYFPNQLKIDSINCDFRKQYVRGLGFILMKTAKVLKGSSMYNAQSVEAELKTIFCGLTRNYDILHYSYAEPYFNLSSNINRRLSRKLVLTNHQPISWWSKNKHLIKKFNNADTIIALSQSDQKYFANIFSTEVKYIPHGVNTNFYTPGNSKNLRDDNSAMFVVFSGRYLRDVDTLTRIIKKISLSGLNIIFNLIYYEKKTVSNKLTEVMNNKNVIWYSNLSEQKYLEILQSSHCCLIPLEDCSANNAILESMACGLPIITTDLPSVKSYLDDSFTVLGQKHNADELSDALLMLYNDENKRMQMSANARKKAEEHFDWVSIAEQTLTIFKT